MVHARVQPHFYGPLFSKVSGIGGRMFKAWRGRIRLYRLSQVLIARHALDVFDDLLARAPRCLSHRPLLSGYDEQQTLAS